MSRFFPLFTISCLWSFSLSSLQAQQPLFQSEEIIHLTLTCEWQNVLDDRGHDPNYHKAILGYTDETGRDWDIEVKVKARGNYRKDPFMCDFPPLRINFDKDMTEPRHFTGINKLKMVTHCQTDEYILREYYIYRMYQLFTDYSLRVRLVKIDYVDAEGISPTETHYSFFIEDADDMAERFGAVEIDDDILVEAEDVTAEDLLRIHMFQYMIANMDFVVADRQNVKIITNPERGGRPLVVPYDFDWSGLVDASYTRMTLGENVSSYERRQKYKKLCLPASLYESMMEEFLDKKDAIWSLYENSELLSEESVDYTLDNLKSFFKTIKKSKSIDKVFLADCNQGN